MNGFKSRKFVLALLGVSSGIIAAFILPVFPQFIWLREYSVEIFAAACTLAAAYIVGNAIVARNHAQNGDMDAPMA